MTVAVDFDGVIHAYSDGWRDGSIYDDPVPGAFDALHRLMDAGHAVFIHTSRDPYQVGEWIYRRSSIGYVLDPGGKFWYRTGVLLVTNRKLPAMAYIDDRGIRFESWGQALADLATHEGIVV